MSNLEAKIVLIGESAVGKTSILSRFFRNIFTSTPEPSLNCSFSSMVLNIKGISIKLNIWDTVGQEKFRALTRIFYEDAKAVILVYDTTNEKSFDELENYWYNEIKENTDKNVIIALAGNKIDLYEEERVTEKDACEFAKSIDALNFRTSAKEGLGIKELFSRIGEKIINNKKSLKERRKTVSLNSKNIFNNHKKCC